MLLLKYLIWNCVQYNKILISLPIIIYKLLSRAQLFSLLTNYSEQEFCQAETKWKPKKFSPIYKIHSHIPLPKKISLFFFWFTKRSLRELSRKHVFSLRFQLVLQEILYFHLLYYLVSYTYIYFNDHIWIIIIFYVIIYFKFTHKPCHHL